MDFGLESADFIRSSNSWEANGRSNSREAIIPVTPAIDKKRAGDCLPVYCPIHHQPLQNLQYVEGGV